MVALLSAWNTFSHCSSLPSVLLSQPPESLGLNVIFPVRLSQTVLLTVNTPQPCLRELHCLHPAFSLSLSLIRAGITFYYARYLPIDYVYCLCPSAAM